MSHAFRPDALAICVPIRNEEALLPALIGALMAQELDGACDVTLCCLLDDCRDASATIVAEAAEQLPFAVSWAAIPAGGSPNAGRARRAAMALGEDAIAGRAKSVLLTTDADSVPSRDWIAAACRALATSDVVAGRIVRDIQSVNPAQDRLEAYYERLYTLRRHYDPVPWEPKPAHHYVGGANLGFRADAYRTLGGFEPLPSGEDATIIDTAHRMGLRVSRDRTMVVHTSGRVHGRAVNGLADHLRGVARNEVHAQVAHPEDAVWQFRGHALARSGFDALPDMAAADMLANALAVDVAHVHRVANLAANAEAFATCVVPSAPGGDRMVTLVEAEAALEKLEQIDLERAA